MNRDRMRCQLRAWPTGPEITSYSAAMIASIDATSAGAAAGRLLMTGITAGGAGAACAWSVAGSGAMLIIAATEIKVSGRTKVSREFECVTASFARRAARISDGRATDPSKGLP